MRTVRKRGGSNVTLLQALALIFSIGVILVPGVAIFVAVVRTK